MNKPIRVLVAGCGHMGKSHALAYRNMPDKFEIVGLVARGAGSRSRLNRELGGGFAEFSDYKHALDATRPDAVCISTYPETHADYTLAAFAAGADVFLEKPIATTLEACERVVAAAGSSGRKLVIGYILQVHPSWKKFTDIARQLGKPLVMRMNLNQQSSGSNWHTHRQLMASASPVVDCGVHYVDVMCRMTGSRPVRVSGIGVRLSEEIPANQFNYGQLQVTFADGSVGWYEAGWGPMMSETAYFVKDVIGPQGCVSIVARKASQAGRSADVDAHTQTEVLLRHHSALTPGGQWAKADELIDADDEPDHNELCRREQELFHRAIRGEVDLADHLAGAANSLRVVLAADRAMREGRTIELT